MQSRVGVVAVQGDAHEHGAMVDRAVPGAVDVEHVRTAGTIPDCDAVILPGGESTTISRLIHETGIATELEAHVEEGKPLLATCAGLIVCARDAQDDRVRPLGFLDVTIERNAFGRQRDSFEAPLRVDGLDDPFPGVFIRAPRLSDVGTATVLATLEGEPVAIEQGSVIGASFHPELTGDPRFHRRAIANGR